MKTKVLVAVMVSIILLCVFYSLATDISGYFKSGHIQDMRSKNNCTQASKDSLCLVLKFRPGRTGSQLFRIYCLIALANKFCYTAVIDIQYRTYFDVVLSYFDLQNVQLLRNVNTSTFHDIKNVQSEMQLQEVAKHRHNWILSSQCFGYEHFEDQEQFVRSSVRLKKHITKAVADFVSHTFENRSTVAIAVRRTDRINHTFYNYNYQYSDLKWYKPFIHKAMSYLKRIYSDLVFIFVSDDISWCKANFNGQDIHFSAFASPGHDLALIARCDHMIITFGSFAWHGAWLGDKKKTVVYSKDYLPGKYTETSFLYPWWTGV